MLKSFFGINSTKNGFKWIGAWKNDTKNQFSVVLKEIQTEKFFIKNFEHNSLLESRYIDISLFDINKYNITLCFITLLFMINCLKDQFRHLKNEIYKEPPFLFSFF